MAQTVDTRDLDRLMDSWDTLLKQFPAKKREMLERLGPKMLQAVRAEIGGEGKVAGWQAPHMGSKGGYVAVRAKADTYQATKSGRRYAVGYVTNAIEGGHRHGGRRGSSKPGYRYRPRYHTPAVPGRWFYDQVRQELPDMAETEIRQLLDYIADGLEGQL